MSAWKTIVRVNGSTSFVDIEAIESLMNPPKGEPDDPLEIPSFLDRRKENNSPHPGCRSSATAV